MKDRLGVFAADVANLKDEEFYDLLERAEGLEITLADKAGDGSSQEAEDAAHIVDWLNL